MIAPPTPSTLAQSKERKGSNFAIWQPCFGLTNEVPLLDVLVGDAESLVEVEEDCVGGDLAEAEVAVRGARRVAAVERGQDALLHQERKHLEMGLG